MRFVAITVTLGVALAACGDNSPVNQEPSIGDLAVSTAEDTPVVFTLDATDPEGAPLQLSFEPPAHGTLAQNDRSFTYTPAADYHGADEVRITVTDGELGVEATVAITVTPVNDAPLAADDTLASNEDSVATVSTTALLANDTDVDGDTLSVTAVTAATGTATLTDGTVTYAPVANFVGTATFEYTVSDGTATDTGTVTVTVGGDNDAPVAVDDVATTAEDTALVVATATLLANDSDVEAQSLSVTTVSNPSSGSVTVNAGTVTYTPAADFNGTATFAYAVSDGAASDTGQVTVTVSAVNDAPVATAATVTTDEDTAVTVTFAGTDVDTGTTLTAVVVSGPAQGTLSSLTRATATSFTATYTPPPDSNGAEAIAFVMNDGTVDSAPASVTITVGAINDAPLGTPAAVTTDEDTAVTITFAGTDVDAAATLDAVVEAGPAHGTLGPLTRASATSFTATYTPEANFYGIDAITFRVNDGTADSSTTGVIITVNAINDVPTVMAATVTTDEDTAVTVTFIGSDPDVVVATTFDAVIDSGPAHGTLSAPVRTGPTVFTATYTPAADHHGPDAITFHMTDGVADSSTATVTITVAAINDVPVATAATVTTDEDTAVTVTFAGTDVDAGTTLGLAIVSGPTHGTLGTATRTSATAFTATYTPAPDYNGGDSITFRVTDGTADSATAAVTITVATVNDTPVATAAAVTTNEDTAVTVTFAGTDADGDTLDLVVDGTPAHGTLGTVTRSSSTSFTATYTPSGNYTGSDSIPFHLNDGVASSVGAAVSITVTSVNDAPVATAATVTTNEDTAVTVTFAGTDVDTGATLTAVVDGGPASGTLGALTRTSATTFTATYTPATNYNGPDAITFHVNDGTVDSAGASVTITVAPLNDAPVATAASVTTNEDSAVTVTFAGTDVDTGTTLGFVIDSGPAHGTLGTATRTSATSFTATYTPTGNYNGPDAITFRVSDGSIASASATVSITVTALNDAPVAADGNSTVDEDSSVNALVSATDPDGASVVLTFTIVTPPAHGTLGTFVRLTPNLGYFPYTPAANYNGPDSFTYRASDGTATSANVGTETLTVNPVNDAPIAFDGNSTVGEDDSVSALVSGSDPDGASTVLTFTIVTPPAHGALGPFVRITPSVGFFPYTPAANYHGPDSFTYRVSDGTATSANLGTESITVTSVSDGPVATPGATSTNEDSPVVITLVGADADGDPLTFAIVTPPATGTLGAITQASPFTATVTYTPPANGTTDTSFTFQVSDASATSAPATVSIDVVPVNDAPLAIAGSSSVAQNGAVVLTLQGIDLEGDALGFAIVTAPGHGSLGTLTLSGNGSAQVTYTPTPGSTIDDAFTFHVSDASATSAAATFAVTVTGATVCGDGYHEDAETCDDGGTDPGDGCSDTCTVENGYVCTGATLSTCDTVCGDTIVAGDETCEDGNSVDTDGCTSQCQAGPTCSAANPRLAGGSRFSVDAVTGHCYVAYNTTTATWATAETSCESVGGHLATIASASEQAAVAFVQNTAQTPWIGASDSAAEGTFRWLGISLALPQGAPLTYTNFASTQPDHNGAAPHCLQLASGVAAGQWQDAPCATAGAFGRVCEIELPGTQTCGDGVLQSTLTEECDDGNLVSGDGCSATCTAEIYISEYAEALPTGSFEVGAPQNDFIEFHNASPSKVVLPGNCNLYIYKDSGTMIFGSTSVPATAKTLEPGGTLTFCNNLMGAALLARCPSNNVAAGVVNKSMTFVAIQYLSGDDTVVLRCNNNLAVPEVGVVYDVIGQVNFPANPNGWGIAPVNTTNHTLRRKCGIPVIRKTDPYAAMDDAAFSAQFDSFPVDTVDDAANRSCP